MPPKRSGAPKAKSQETKAGDTKSQAALDPNQPIGVPEGGAPAKEAATSEDKPPVDEVVKDDNATNPNGEQRASSSGRKRKNAEAPNVSNKAARRSARGGPKPTTVQLLNYLLSPAATTLCLPKDEEEKGPQAEVRTYTGNVPLSPFEELMCAIVLSRPISHRLGQRAIKVLLNEPYAFNTPGALRNAGPQKREQALWDARTQHKQKTADQLGGLADVVIERFVDDESDDQLSKLRSSAAKDIDVIHRELQTNIKGVGKTGLDIFFRRVQGHWGEVYPFVDPKTEDSVARLGLPRGEEELQALVEKHWSDLKTDDIKGAKDEETVKRHVFVRILERAVNADLDNKVDDLLDEAAKS